MRINLKTVLGIGAAGLLLAVVVAVRWPVTSPPPPPVPQAPPPKPQTLCNYLKSAVDAMCAVASAPDDLALARAVVVPAASSPAGPLPLSGRDFASVCWLRSDDQPRIRTLLARPAADMALPGFTTEIGRNLQAGETVSLAEADNVKLRAGPRVDLVRSVTLGLRGVRAVQLNQEQMESLLARPEVREDCFSRLLGLDTKLLISAISADGIDYSISTSEGQKVDLETAVTSGYVDVDPGMRGAGTASGEPAAKKPVLIGAVFADDALISKLKTLVPSGNVITVSSSNHLDASVSGAGELRGAQADVAQAPDGSLTIDSAALTTAIAAKLAGRPGAAPAMTVSFPRIEGAATATSTHSEAGAPVAKAAAEIKTDLRYGDPLIRGDIRWPVGSASSRAGQANRHIQEFLALALSQRAIANFDVFKRLDGPDTLAVELKVDRLSPGTSPLGSRARVIITDPSDQPLATAEADLRTIGPEGHITAATVSQAGIYHVTVTQEGSVSSTVQLTVRTDVSITTSLTPERAAAPVTRSTPP